MPYDFSAYAATQTQPAARVLPVRTDDDFHRAERLVVVVAASLLGAMIGGAVAVGFGYVQPWAVSVAGAPVYGLALYFAVCSFRDAADRNAWGCAIATS